MFLLCLSTSVKSDRIREITKKAADHTVVVYLGHLPVLLFVTAVKPLETTGMAVIFILCHFIGGNSRAPVLSKAGDSNAFYPFVLCKADLRAGHFPHRTPSFYRYDQHISCVFCRISPGWACIAPARHFYDVWTAGVSFCAFDSAWISGLRDPGNEAVSEKRKNSH